MNIKKNHSLKDKEIYKEILLSEKEIAIPYYLTTDIIVNEENIEFLVDLEEVKYKESYLKSNLKFNLRDKIEERISSFLNSNLLEMKYIYLNKHNIEDYKNVEKLDIFNKWLIK